MRTSTLIKAAVALVLVVGLSLFLFLPYAPVTENLKDYEGSEYYPLIQEISEYRVNLNQPKHKNRFQTLMSAIGSFGMKDAVGVAPEDNVDMMGGDAGMENGGYVEVTDNQVAGVVESDIFKMSEKYIFRLGYKINSGNSDRTSVLRVYSVDKENSGLVGEFTIPSFKDERYNGYDYQMMEMYLSQDSNTVTITKNYNSSEGSNIGIISIDVSNINNISIKGMVSVEGSLNTSRMVDGKLLVVTDFYFIYNTVDYSDPSTFVPTIDRGNGAEVIKFEDIIYPDGINNTRYSVVAMFSEGNLELLGANALLNFTSDVYISENNIYLSREYTEKTETQNGGYITKNMSEVAIIGYSGDSLEKRGSVTFEGWTKDQYSFDEKDGYLRVVASTSNGEASNHGETSSFSQKRNVSLYIFNLEDNSLAYSVEDFAIEGEEAASVRFNGDKLYVCSAVVITFTDPVYFFDLSDYENITFTDTGVIEGFSTSLVDMGEGFLLGIGQLNQVFSKVEIYEERGDSVVSVDVYEFFGSYSTEYKSFFINREENLFGFAVDYYHDDYSDNGLSQRYILLHFNGYSLEVIDYVDIPDMMARTTRAAYVDGYLYITTDTRLVVRKIK